MSYAATVLDLTKIGPIRPSAPGLATGQQLIVTGMSYQFIDYEVDPRFQSDIRRREG